MDGVQPQSSPLLLRRVIINTIPAFGSRRVLEAVKKEAVALAGESADASSAPTPAANETGEEEVHEIVEEGCCPYLQIFKGGKLVFTTTWRDMETGSGVQWAGVNDGSISFNVNCMLQGDILIRCRHLTDAGERVSMFRGAFHTGYIPQGILRLTKAQLDGACGDPRFDQDFFVDLIFADVETEAQAEGSAANSGPKSEGVALTEEDRQAYEDMLHRDEAFWVDIEARKVRLQKLREEQLKKKQQLEAEAAAARAAAAEAAAAAEKAATDKQAAHNAQSSFSIVGGDDDPVPRRVSSANRKGSWDEAKDKELMSELESLTAGALAKAADSDELLLQYELEEKATDKRDSPVVASAAVAGLAKEFEDMQSLEKELGLEAFSTELASLPDGKLEARLEALDAELEGLGSLSPSAKDASAADVMNFAADDFDELEEYLSGLSTSTS
ncbi:hypothetical protein PybrP1_009199 [[Pythium] brassicae (nom. inval.)]|nr:hypothetical protein PybrP1_009199 [[Pythium] brassicae (nom. inval.)]